MIAPRTQGYKHARRVWWLQSSVAGASLSFCSFSCLNHVLSENTFGTGRGSASGQTTLPSPFLKGHGEAKSNADRCSATILNQRGEGFANKARPPSPRSTVYIAHLFA